MLENKINNYGYIDRLLSIWYNKSDNEVFEHYFNKFAKEVITTYLEQCRNKEKAIKFIQKSSNTSYNEYREIEQDIKETFENDFLLYDVFEHIIY